MSAQRCKEILCSNLAAQNAASQIDGADFGFEHKAKAYSLAASALASSGEVVPDEILLQVIAEQEAYIGGGTAEKYVGACVDLWDQITT